MTKLQRTTFETSRAAEYFDARQLSALTGVSQDEFASVCLKELVDNALDACETAQVEPVVSVEAERDDETILMAVADNGPGIPPEVVRKVLDYSIRVSDKAAYRSPTRGAQGNALKTVIGIPYALGSQEPLIVAAQGVRHSIAPWVDPAGVVHFDYASTQAVTEGTTVGLTIPRYDRRGYGQDFDPLHWVRSFAAFNPHAGISYRLRTAVQRWPKFTNRPSRGLSRSTYPPSRQARTGTAQAPLRAWSLTTSPTPGAGVGTYPSVSSSGSSRGSRAPGRRRPSPHICRQASRTSQTSQTTPIWLTSYLRR
jgi:DNA topoisomerase VI subunit B